ncbi:hypothetical protein PM10SUCC1_25180 [Propionigenium maris DSM 9537]|uniref:TonB C-terminal domain-containing protein n=1 Tax=Propionigenium maris DSM 9537 TaxID=1123000 RepID=A0A9W6LNL1_9FUSO|nr:energy transducer TonB [Propionigenium maris]GLI57004.1 hypothetical protein PM10SUCC1_25180 [Propionigenium maris DSM 9537]
MIRELVVSCIIHLMVVAFVMRMPQTPPQKIGRVGERIEVRMTSSKAGTPSEAKKGSGSEDQKKRVEKKTEIKKEEKREEKKVEKKVPEKKVERKPVEKPKKKAERVEKKPEEKSEEKPEVVAASEAAEEITKDASEEAAADNPKVTEESEEAVEGTGDKDLTAGSADGNDLDEGLVRLSDGSLSAKHQGVKGLSYGIISNPEPTYPSVAKRLGFKGDMVVRVVMQFDSNGNLEDFRFVDERDKFGFANEVEKILKNWRLTPIEYKGQLVNMKFHKSFRFSIENS